MTVIASLMFSTRMSTLHGERMDRVIAIALGTLLLTLLAASAGTAHAQSGSALYRDYCRGCHGGLPGNPNLLNGGDEANLYVALNQNSMASVAFMSSQPDWVTKISAYIANYAPPPPPPPPPPPAGPGQPPTSPPPPPAPPPPAPPEKAPPTGAIVEYFHAGFGHYFVTSIDAEIAALDSGKFAGWTRTGQSFKTYTASNGQVSGVCRFFTVAFPPKSSHFYTSNTAECQGVQAGNRDWTFEAVAFWVQSADGVSGSCPTGSKAVYRLYNNGQSGAPNHRYTIDPGIRADMMAKGWIPEGFGPDGVGFCSPN